MYLFYILFVDLCIYIFMYLFFDLFLYVFVYLFIYLFIFRLIHFSFVFCFNVFWPISIKDITLFISLGMKMIYTHEDLLSGI